MNRTPSGVSFVKTHSPMPSLTDGPNVGSDRVVEFLREPATYGEPAPSLQWIETHISWIFLTDRYAYKLKKPVRFDFLDFSTPQLRQTACQHELELNRRLAPDTYLAVVPVTLNRSGNLCLGGSGPAVDWVVKMRRLPENRALDRLIRTHSLADADVERISARLSDFYRRLPPVSLRSEDYRHHIEERVEANRRELLDPQHALSPRLIRRAHAAQLRVLRLYPELLDNRVCDGRIIDGHGDLRPEHIYLTPQVTVIDCIEFNPELRQIDVLDELSFLAVECAALGAPGVGGQILDQYCRLTGDQPASELLAFYMCYRATVRAKVHALRAAQLRTISAPESEPAPSVGIEDEASQEQHSGGTARDYLLLAHRYAAELGPPIVLIVRGLSGTGKTTLALALAESLGIECLSTDTLRGELFALRNEPGEYDEGRYQSESRGLVYQAIFDRAAESLQGGASLVLDGTFLTTRLRTQAVLLARHCDALPVLVHCQCPDDVARERIARRIDLGESVSDARPEFVDRQRGEAEVDPVGAPACEVDTTSSLPEMLDTVFRYLRWSLRAGPQRR